MTPTLTHERHEIAPTSGANSPAWHGSHCALPVELLYEPLVQLWQTDEPLRGWKVPAAHLVQLVAPLAPSSFALPGSHMAHDVWPVAL